MEQLAPGLWAWTARHPEWQPGQDWDAEVRCFLVAAEGETLAIDPLVPAGSWSDLDEARPTAVLLTQAAHARSAAETARRYGAGVWGHPHAAEKLGGAEFHPIAHRDLTPGGARVLPFDELPDGSGTPLYLPSHRAAAVGDVFILVDGALRVWWTSHDDEEERWYHERYVPSLRAWLELPLDHVLVSHGERAAVEPAELEAALERAPYAHD